MNYNLKSKEHALALKKLQEKIGYTFKNEALLLEALRHTSYVAEYPQLGKSNQRLEFLGDAVLELVLTSYIFDKCPDSDEGVLTKIRSYLSNEEANTDYTRKLELDKLLLLGKGEDAANGRNKPSLLGDLFEAFLGALYCDGGYECAEKLCLSLLPSLEDILARFPKEENPKGALQEFCQEHSLGRPTYELLSRTGPVHKPLFSVRIVLGKKEMGRATGNSLKGVEKQLAGEALKSLRQILMSQNQEQERQVVVALDFDGVICDSAGETGMSGWKAARKIWPKLFVRKMPSPKALQVFRQVRPFLETGYHAILLTKMLQEKLPFQEFQQNCQFHFQRIMDENGLDKQELIRIFGETRDSWIQENEEEWLGVHGFFDGILDALNALLKSNCKAYILTTKHERFVLAALKSRGVDFPAENIFGLDRKKKKEEHLLDILAEKPSEVHFVEDRLDTLRRIEAVPSLDCVKLHYATWGYGTEQDNLDAAEDKRLTVHTLQDFNRWLSNI